MAAPGGNTDRASRRAAIAFNEAINRRDLDTLRQLMTDDHAFIDSEGTVLAGKTEVLNAWEGFFAAFPDYRNDWSKVMTSEASVVAIGRSFCTTEPALAGPAIWTARTAGGKLSEWCVLEDTPVSRSRLGIVEASH
jgi:ketosteroid isomerase-like protein